MRSPEEGKEDRSSWMVLRDGRADHRGKRMTAICNFSKETFTWLKLLEFTLYTSFVVTLFTLVYEVLFLKMAVSA